MDPRWNVKLDLREKMPKAFRPRSTKSLVRVMKTANPVVQKGGMIEYDTTISYPCGPSAVYFLLPYLRTPLFGLWIAPLSTWTPIRFMDCSPIYIHAYSVYVLLSYLHARLFGLCIAPLSTCTPVRFMYCSPIYIHVYSVGPQNIKPP